MPASVSSPAPATGRAGLSIPFGAQVLIGLAAGVLLGVLARQTDASWLAQLLTQVGAIFAQLPRVLVVPLVLTALVVSITHLRKVTNAARLAVQTLLWFAITAAAAVTIGILLGLLTNPGSSASLPTTGAQASPTQGTWLDFLKSVIPANILGLEASSAATSNGASVAITTSLSFNVLQLVVIGILIGAAALAVGEKAQPLIDVAAAALEIFQKLTWWVIKLTPIGSAALIGKAIARYGWDLLQPLAVFAGDVYLGCLLVLFGLYPALLRLHGLSVRRFFYGAWEAIVFAFVSRSSVATLPITRRDTIDRLGVPSDYASFAVPLGATTKMDGCAAVYPALAAITVAQLFGIELGTGHYLLIAFVAVVGSAATAGLTGATVMLTLTLSTLGLPLEGVGLLLAVDPILDMIRTATNIAGQALVPVLVARRNRILDLDRYYGRSEPAADLVTN